MTSLFFQRDASASYFITEKQASERSLKEKSLSVCESAFPLKPRTIEGHVIQYPIIQHINSCARVITLVVFLPQVKF